MLDLSRKNSRARLHVRREPYWQRLKEGDYLGFRRGPDTWIARHRQEGPFDTKNRKRTYTQKYEALSGAVEYDEAKAAAEVWFAQLRGTPVRAAKRGTVREALETYLAELRRQGRADAATENEARFKGIVWDDQIAAQALESLTLDDMIEFRERLREGRQNRSVNRHMTSMIAGLNVAHSLGHVGNPAAWKLKRLSDDREDDGETAVFLTAEQRAAIIRHASKNAAAFLRGLELTGARPKELAAATVADFDGEQLKVAHRKGRPTKLRTRYVVLSADGCVFFKAQTKGKLPGAPIFAEDGAQPWRRHVWAREIRAAIKAHNEDKKTKPKARVPVAASAYSFRHARISELLQVHSIDPLTVAAQTGMSLATLEKAYFKFIPSAMREKLAAVKES
jgi:integrase